MGAPKRGSVGPQMGPRPRGRKAKTKKKIECPTSFIKMEFHASSVVIGQCPPWPKKEKGRKAKNRYTKRLARVLRGVGGSKK